MEEEEVSGAELLAGDPAAVAELRAGRVRKVDPERPTPAFELEGVQLDPATGAWLVDRPPLMPPQRFASEEEWQARIGQARATFGKD